MIDQPGNQLPPPGSPFGVPPGGPGMAPPSGFTSQSTDDTEMTGIGMVLAFAASFPFLIVVVSRPIFIFQFIVDSFPEGGKGSLYSLINNTISAAVAIVALISFAALVGDYSRRNRVPVQFAKGAMVALPVFGLVSILARQIDGRFTPVPSFLLEGIWFRQLNSDWYVNLSAAVWVVIAVASAIVNLTSRRPTNS